MGHSDLQAMVSVVDRVLPVGTWLMINYPQLKHLLGEETNKEAMTAPTQLGADARLTPHGLSLSVSAVQQKYYVLLNSL
jgi:hypothetical protein